MEYRTLFWQCESDCVVGTDYSIAEFMDLTSLPALERDTLSEIPAMDKHSERQDDDAGYPGQESMRTSLSDPGSSQDNPIDLVSDTDEAPRHDTQVLENRDATPRCGDTEPESGVRGGSAAVDSPLRFPEPDMHKAGKSASIGIAGSDEANIEASPQLSGPVGGGCVEAALGPGRC